MSENKDLKVIDFLEANYTHYNICDIEDNFCDFINNTYGNTVPLIDDKTLSDILKIVDRPKYYDKLRRYISDNYKYLGGRYWKINDYNCAVDEHRDYQEGVS